MGTPQALSAATVVAALRHLNLKADAQVVHSGHRVATYRITPGSGTTVASIRSRVEDLGVTLGIQAPRVFMRDGMLLVEALRPDPIFPSFVDVAPRDGLFGRLYLGVDTLGRDVCPGIDDLPHLLVSATTGAGKSVALHTMLHGLLLSHTPADLRLILIDPKRVEFARYARLPHLAAPVICDAGGAVKALYSLASEMERRYEALAAGLPVGPRVMVFVDEYADLRGAGGDAVDDAVGILGQKARAANINMVLATQRPSVQVIGGAVKANFPSRMSLRVATSVDSRVALGHNGAETLLGKGDALFLHNGELNRLQVPLVSEGTSRLIVGHY